MATTRDQWAARALELAQRGLAAARRLHDSEWFERGAQVGFAVNGVLHVLIGVLAIAVAFGLDSDKADPSGAIRAVSETPGGIVLVWVIAAGFVALGLWFLFEALLVHAARSEWAKAAKLAAKAVAYGALTVPAVTIGLGGRVDTDDDVREISAYLVQTPLGIALLIAGGAAVVAIGGYFIVKGARRTFLDDIRTPRGTPGRIVEVLGVVGYIAKGVALIAVGVLLVVTAVTVDPESAGGLDEALRSVTELPFGDPVLIVIAVGLIVYGGYCGVRARRAKL